MNILGISCYFHDAAAALLCDGALVAAAEEERFTRRKHDPSFPGNAIEFCLRTAGLRSGDLDAVVFFEKPFLKLERLLLSCLGTFPHSRRLFQEAMTQWLGDKLWVKNQICKRVGVSPDRVLFSDHHLSHAASAFLCSPFEDAAVLTVDGVGEWTTTSIGVGRGNGVEILDEIRFPHSIGLLYSAFTAYLGFEVNEGEYKVMGMAPYGTPRYIDNVRRLVRIQGDGSFELDLSYFSFQFSTDRMFNRRFIDLFGPPRAPGLPFVIGEPVSQRYADIAASIQAVTEELVVALARRAHERTGLTRLCMAGGVALNSVANRRVLEQTPFGQIYIQPAAGDGGAALGAALFAHCMVFGKPRGFVMNSAALGEEHAPARAVEALQSAGVSYESFEDEDRLVDCVARHLADGHVAGWVQGRFEWGPRALGYRSILADPRCGNMRDRVNQAVKLRELFRPFAPSITAGSAERYFDLPNAEKHDPAHFMLYVVKVRPEQREHLGAVTHVDGSARLQLVAKERNPLYYSLIERFGQTTGVPVLLNTSFNVRGEPMVNTPEEAISTFLRTGLDLLVMDRFVAVKRR